MSDKGTVFIRNDESCQTEFPTRYETRTEKKGGFLQNETSNARKEYKKAEKKIKTEKRIIEEKVWERFGKWNGYITMLEELKRGTIGTLGKAVTGSPWPSNHFPSLSLSRSLSQPLLFLLLLRYTSYTQNINYYRTKGNGLGYLAIAILRITPFCFTPLEYRYVSIFVSSSSSMKEDRRASKKVTLLRP